MATEETQTLVNSSNISDIDFKLQESSVNKYEQNLLENPQFLRYHEKYEAYRKKNHLNEHLIKENIWPNLTGHTLAGPDKINYRSDSYYFIDEKYWSYGDIVVDEGEKITDNYSLTFFQLGNKLSGHSGIVHGGLLATLLDELTCRLAFQNFESKKGVTANLNINYKKPTYTDNYVLIKCELLKKTGRKCWVKGSVFKFDLEKNLPIEEAESKENLLTECEVLVIEPKWVEDLKNHKQH
ncbi:HotDog domain-containing protein [Scheffersomyces xylosifermentans]|uniref:HotDog domain-containing protein n=1 Tax=Scheffersomyces xylosifermentans TaxID=1304137 RepID=UPI00315DFD06